MDHKEQHHQHHLKEREHEKQQHKEHERTQANKGLLPFHPAWLFAAGAVLALVAMLVWTVFLW